MTEKTRKYAETHIRAQKDAIRRARETAQLARMLWPKDAEDDLHGKVEILTQRLRNAGQYIVANKIEVSAHTAAWRKVKHTQHIADPGDVTQAGWYRDAQAAQKAAEGAVRIARQVLWLAEDIIGDTDAARRLINAAYWAAKDLQETTEDAQEEISCIDSSDETILLFQQMGEWAERLQDAKDDLVAWADAHDYMITRNPT